MEKLSQRENVLLIEEFVRQSYEMRFNLLSKKLEVRECGSEVEFRPLTQKMENSLVRRIKLELEEATKVKATVRELLESEDIPQYDPVREYLGNLPEWDGHNRVNDLLSRIPGITSDQTYWMSIWLRSCVAHWLGMDMLHGNECVPTLIGDQGCGKSTWCHRLLPQHLRPYYLDHFNLSNKFDKEMALTNSLLVNIDELDQIRPAQHPALKQALSKTTVNSRQIYGRDVEERVRYASFVATTNNRHPLVDPTGSRRYICVAIPQGKLIDNDGEIDYDQLYSQLVYEVQHEQMRYWFTNEETLAIQRANAQFHVQQDLAQMLSACYRMPAEDEPCEPVLLSGIVETLSVRFPMVSDIKNLSMHVGAKMREMGFVVKHRHAGNAYLAIPA